MGRRGRLGPLAVGVALLAGAAGVLGATTPWSILSGLHPGPASLDFTHAELARSAAYHAAERALVFPALAVSLLAALALGLTPAGARLARYLALPAGGRWWAQAALGGALAAAVPRLAELPLLAGLHALDRRYGLSLAGWGTWASQQAQGIAVGVVLAAAALTGFYRLTRWLPHRWWLALAAAGAAAVGLSSLLYPVTVARLAVHTRPLAAGALRTDLLALARRDHVGLRQVLVASQAAPTTVENAYVDGLGPTRQLVLYATFLRHASPAEVRLVFAHELGHRKNDDVGHATLAAALAVAAAGCFAPALLGAAARRAGLTGPTDPAGAALVLAAVAAVSLLALPAQNAVSRRIEARADLSALTLTRDPATFVRSQVRISVVDLIQADPPAWLQEVFGTHPSPVQRIAFARRWARQHGVPVPPPLAAR